MPAGRHSGAVGIMMHTKNLTGYHIYIHITIRLKQVFMTFVGFCWCFRSGPFESPFCQAHRAAMCVPGPQDGMM